VDAPHQAAVGEHGDVPAHGHRRDAQPLDQVGQAHDAVLADGGQDELLTLRRQRHRAPPAMVCVPGVTFAPDRF
jgi:hypothetical protein